MDSTFGIQNSLAFHLFWRKPAQTGRESFWGGLAFGLTRALKSNGGQVARKVFFVSTSLYGGFKINTIFEKHVFFLWDWFFYESDYPSQNAEKRIPKNRLRKKKQISKQWHFKVLRLVFFFLRPVFFSWDLFFFREAIFREPVFGVFRRIIASRKKTNLKKK